MRKFTFSLQTLYDLKEKEERNQKIELSKIEARIHLLNEELKALEAEYFTYEHEYREYIKGSIKMEKMKQYNHYLSKQTDLINEKNQEISEQHKIRGKCVHKLIEILKEIKSYKKLRDKQYEEYLVESRRIESRTMDDILSYNTIVT